MTIERNPGFVSSGSEEERRENGVEYLALLFGFTDEQAEEQYALAEEYFDQGGRRQFWQAALELARTNGYGEKLETTTPPDDDPRSAFRLYMEFLDLARGGSYNNPNLETS